MSWSPHISLPASVPLVPKERDVRAAQRAAPGLLLDATSFEAALGRIYAAPLTDTDWHVLEQADGSTRISGGKLPPYGAKTRTSAAHQAERVCSLTASGGRE